MLFLELKQHYDVQVKELVGSHQRELTQLRDDHKVEISRMQKALEVVGWLKHNTKKVCFPALEPCTCFCLFFHVFHLANSVKEICCT